MKTKTTIRLLFLIVALTLLITSASAAAQPDETIQPRYTSVVQFGRGLTINSAGRADCTSFVLLDSPTDSAVLIMSLRRSEDGVTWSSEKTWSTSGNATAALSESIYVLSGYYYKVNVSVTVYNEGGHYIETATGSSEIVNYGVR